MAATDEEALTDNVTIRDVIRKKIVISVTI